MRKMALGYFLCFFKTFSYLSKNTLPFSTNFIMFVSEADL